MKSYSDESVYLFTTYYIADYYGYDAQSNQLIEEMAELTQAISKYSRLRRGTPLSKPLSKRAARENILEGIADVEIMLEQMKYLLNIRNKDIDGVKAKKVERTLEQIKEQKKWTSRQQQGSLEQ